MTPSSILYQNASKTIVLLDLPRSIEEAQVLSSSLARDVALPRRLISAVPPNTPFPTPESKNTLPAPPSAQVIADLMTAAASGAALAEIHQSHSGPWVLPRIYSHAQSSFPTTSSSTSSTTSTSPSQSQLPSTSLPSIPSPPYLPPKSHSLAGTISSHRSQILSLSPNFFHLILLDPPWPNRSAKRKRRGAAAYQPAPDFLYLRDLLSLIPVTSHLATNGLIAVWVTNSARAVETLTSPSGIFAEWGVELVGEWTWLKVTTGGEPLVGLEATWRRPWERLLIARKRGGQGGPVPGKVVMAVPDVHSRKPSLRALLEELLPVEYQALEVFARNLTAGWWSWGDEVLLFQGREHWVEMTLADDAADAGPGCLDHTS